MSLQEIFSLKFQSVDFVGQGSFGVIASVTCTDSGEARAIKLVDCNDPSVMNEVKLLSEEKYHHGSIVRYFGTWKGDTDTLDVAWRSVLRHKFKSFPHEMIAIELELCDGEETSAVTNILIDLIVTGDLHHFLNNRNHSFFKGTPVSDDTNQKLDLCMKQVAEGLKFLHESGIVHRDIKPENILYDQRSNWKISDLGLARIIATSMTPAVGTPLYFAPEQDEKHYDSRVDVYAFGLIIFEICYPVRNYGHFRDSFARLRRIPPLLPGMEARLSNYSEEHENLIRGMIQRLPEDRTSIDAVVSFLRTG